MKLSNQAMGSIMMALQKSILEQTDIVPILNEFNFKLNEREELEVDNPPNFTMDKEIFKPETIKTTGSD